MRKYYQPNTVEAQLERSQHRLIKESESEIATALQQTTALVEASGHYKKELTGELALGAVGRIERFPEHIKISYVGRTLFLNEGDKNSLIDKHIFILGAPGSGKTTLLLRIIYELLFHTDRNFWIVDGKGDPEFAKTVAALCWLSGRGRAKVFKYGYGRNEPCDAYNPFVGEPDDIVNRLGAMLKLDTAGDLATQHHATIAESLLQLICGVGEEAERLKVSAPLDLKEIVERMTWGWLEKTYKDSHEMDAIRSHAKEGAVVTLHEKLNVLNRAFGKIINRNGFKLEDTPCAIFSIRTQSTGIDGQKILALNIEDVKDLIGKRQHGRGCLLIDELGTFNQNKGLESLLRLARSFNVSVIAGTQDLTNLGDQDEAQGVLSVIGTFFVGQTNFPEEMSKMAGTRKRSEPTIQFEGSGTLDKGSVRLQDTFRLSPEEVAKLPPGQFFCVNSRHKVKLCVARVLDPPDIPEALAPDIVEPIAPKEEPPQQDVEEEELFRP